MRVGNGYDIHRFRRDGGGTLRLGGVEIEGAPQLEGHSDGDALIHAVIDALLGAAGAGDIGQHFPPGEEATAGIDSRELLRRVVRLIAAQGYRLENLDATVIAEFAITRPTTNVTNTASPAMMPPAVAAARNTTTWVGVSAPIPWMAPIPTAPLVE